MQPLVSLKWAKNYFVRSRPKADEWTAAKDAERKQYLGWASVLIKSAFVFQDGIAGWFVSLFTKSEWVHVGIDIGDQRIIHVDAYHANPFARTHRHERTSPRAGNCVSRSWAFSDICQRNC